METGGFETQLDELRFFRRLPWEKIATWAIFLLIIYVLRNFLDIIVVTFVLSYIAHNIVCLVCGRFCRPGDDKNVRRTVVVGVFVVFVAGLVGLGYSLLPTIYTQAENLFDRIRVQMVETTGGPAGDELPAKQLSLPEGKTVRAQVGPEAPSTQAPGMSAPSASSPSDLKQLIKNRLRRAVGEDRYNMLFGSKMFESLLESALSSLGEVLPKWTAKAGEYLQKLVTILIHFLISVFFSFLIVWDLPKLEHTTIRLPAGRFRNFCREIIPSLLTFSSVMGRAFQAQTIIAFCNTLLTFIGLSYLGIENRYFLSVVVFLCSFIPVLGVFLSTFPMGLVALLQKDGGVGLMMGALAMVVVLHLIEGYVLNPRIMGERFEMHPLVVLVILLIGKDLFGIWGLLLGVPLFHYLFHYVIMAQEDASVRVSGLWHSLYPETGEALVRKTEFRTAVPRESSKSGSGTGAESSKT